MELNTIFLAKSNIDKPIGHFDESILSGFWVRVPIASLACFTGNFVRGFSSDDNLCLILMVMISTAIVLLVVFAAGTFVLLIGIGKLLVR